MWIDSRAKKHRLTHCAAIISRPSVYTENYDITTQAWEYPLVQQESSLGNMDIDHSLLWRSASPSECL